MLQLRLTLAEAVQTIATPENKRYPWIGAAMGPNNQPLVLFFVGEKKAVNFITGEILTDVPEHEFKPARAVFDSLTRYAGMTENQPAEAPIIIPAFVQPPANLKKP